MSQDEGTAAIRVMLVDDQPMILNGISMMLKTSSDIEVVATASNGIEAVALERETRPDVIVMDIRMPELDGIQATRQILAVDRPESQLPPAILVLTTFDHDDYVIDALVAGASGFLLKDASTEELLGAVRTVAGGEAILDPSVTRALVKGVIAARRVQVAPDPAVVALLTPRELDIVALLAQGMSNLELADRLVLSEQTVKTHIRNILAKLQLRDRTQVVAFAYQNGLDGEAIA